MALYAEGVSASLLSEGSLVMVAPWMPLDAIVLALQEYAEPEKSKKVEFLAEVVVPAKNHAFREVFSMRSSSPESLWEILDDFRRFQRRTG